MKIRTAVAVILSMLLISVGAKAQVGDVTGNIYTTDIAAFIDGMPIKSYNIGGKTAVVVEELKNYGFYVEWKPEERQLVVKTEYAPSIAPEYTHKAESIGEVVGNIYETDITVTVNGIEVPSFCLDGVTAVAIEGLVDLTEERYSYDQNSHMNMSKPYADTGMYYVWNGEARTISLNTLRPGSKIETDFGELLTGSNGWSVERMDYRLNAYGFAGMDGEYYAHYSTVLEIDGEKYASLSDMIKMFSGGVEANDDVIDLSINVKNATKMRMQSSFSKLCSNILYPLCAKLSVNGNVHSGDKKDFYVYKGEVYVSIDAVNECAGAKLFSDYYALPEECTTELGKILYSKHILYINGYAVTSYLAENGEYYIPVDSLSDAGFDIVATETTRTVTTPRSIPGAIDDSQNYPENYYLEDYQNEKYVCSFYNSPFSVTIDNQEISSVYIKYSSTMLTPCIPLSELIAKTGYSQTMEENGNIRVYTRDDKITAKVDYNSETLVIMRDNEPFKSFSIYDYHDVGVFDNYLYLAASSDRYGITEIYNSENFEKIIEVAGHIKNIANGKILAFENTEADGEWARKYFVYDLTGKLLDSYIDNK